MTSPLISICIPTYNGVNYLAECLDACLGQSFRDYEIVICDDGSTDGTVELIADYARQHDRIRFTKNEKNLGLVGNWNKCVELARGNWIKFVFQDDYISGNCLEVFASSIKADVQLLVSARNFILPEHASQDYQRYYTTEVRTLENTTAHRQSFFSPELISKIAVQNMCMNFIGEPSLTLFRKTLIHELGPFNNSLKQICDLEFVLRVASIHGLVYIPEKLCAFRIHNQSTTTTNLAHNYYQLHYIEPLVFSSLLLHDKAYRSFRSHLSILLTFKLNLYFQLKCYMAYKVNREEKRDHELFRTKSAESKKIDQYKNGTLLVRILALFRK